MPFRSIPLIVVSVFLFAATLYFLGHPGKGLSFHYGENAALYGADFSPKNRRQIAMALEKVFGTYDDPRLPEGMGISCGRLKNGREFYRRQCLHCHGVTGDGAGTTAPFILPRPRDYRLGVFKITTTAPGRSEKPARADLLRTLKEGMPGSLMPSFALFDDPVLEAAIDYVLHLSMRGELEQKLVILHRQAQENEEEVGPETVQSALDGILQSWKDADRHVVTPKTKRPAPTADSIARGKEIYLSKRANCVSCHGLRGRGDGPNASSYRDDWGNKIVPADLTLGIYLGGRRPVDLFRRVYSGIKGTPMPASAGVLSEEEIWHVVHYVQSVVAEAGEKR